MIGSPSSNTVHGNEGGIEAERQLVKPQKDRRKQKKRRFNNGNYDRYYTYRSPGRGEVARWADVRLAMLETSWFVGRSCLDIGCNTGVMTIEIARQFRPVQMLGIDIDPSLIGKARENLVSRHQSLLDEPPNTAPNTGCSDESKRGFPDFPHNIDFQALDVLNLDFSQHGEGYGVISCFSVTKWIHLNHGDKGIIDFFQRIFKLLKGGGVFILEPQPWESYKKKKAKNMSENSKAIFQAIRLKPDDFPAYLVEEIGFVDVKQLTPLPTTNKGGATGFQQRPIYVLRKPHGETK
jgi:7SK snRNA methylphosphate capping enzyme